MRERKVDGKAAPKYVKNPFLKHTAEISKPGYRPVYVKPADGTAIITSDGEVHGASLIFQKPMERNGYIKVYAEGIGAILGLKKAGKSVFLLIYERLYGKQGIDKTEVILNYAILPENVREKMSQRTFSRGINECIKVGLIAQSYANGLYYVNPAFIYNGNRFNVVTQYLNKEREQITLNAEALNSEE